MGDCWGVPRTSERTPGPGRSAPRRASTSHPFPASSGAARARSRGGGRSRSRARSGSRGRPAGRSSSASASESGTTARSGRLAGAAHARGSTPRSARPPSSSSSSTSRAGTQRTPPALPTRRGSDSSQDRRWRTGTTSPPSDARSSLATPSCGGPGDPPHTRAGSVPEPRWP